MGTRLRALATAAVLMAAGLVAQATPATAAASGAPGKHFFWAQGQGLPSASQANNLFSHGGAVETKPAVYLIFWGTEWKSGISSSDGAGHTYTGTEAQRYIGDFFANVGGSPWNGVQTQYCQNVPFATFSCSGLTGAQPVTNPSHLLRGTWVDATPVPPEIVTLGLVENVAQDPLAAEAEKAAAHFGYDPNATYMIFTPPGHGATAYGSVYCAYHTAATNPDGSRPVNYAFMPYVPEQGAGCGQNSVNKTNDAYGHGFFDGFSIVGGHEFGEAETDPHAFPYQDGWNDVQTNENGDKCAWTGLGNITLGGQKFAVQPMWSNAANGGQGGCAMKL
jgi:serine protease